MHKKGGDIMLVYIDYSDDTYKRLIIFHRVKKKEREIEVLGTPV